jgi:LysM repeat protein
VIRFRWFALQLAIAGLLLGVSLGALWSSAAATVHGQSNTPSDQKKWLPVPVHNWVMRPTVSPSASPPITKTPDDTSEAAPMLDTAPVTAAAALTKTGTPTYYVVLPGDTLFVIATEFGIAVEAIMRANALSNADILYIGQVLLIPGTDGELLDSALLPQVMADAELTGTVIVPRGTITERMTLRAQAAGSTSPFYQKTWLTYYGRPNIDVMGILGEHSIEDLVPLLRAEAEAYDRANGDHLTVMPAFHLVYGMATKAAGVDNSHLAYMAETEVISYIEAAEAEGWGVILDVQIGALSPTDAISPALEYLKYPNVHLAIDPEFAMSHAGQLVPGNPIGFVNAEQVNEVQAVIDSYLAEEQLPAPRILLVHQFQSSMIVDKEKLDASSYPHVALTLSVDGWGGPWGKVSKYNSLVATDSPFVAFKLFYRWDEPLMLPDEALGNRPYRGSDFFMDVTPNLIIYQ